MTTIIYDHVKKEIAVDGRVTCGNIIDCDDYQKWYLDDGKYWFFSGAISDHMKLLEAIKLGAHIDYDVDAVALVADQDSVSLCTINQSNNPSVTILKWSDAIGTGADFAKAALDHGKSARDAVAYASIRDVATGGKISVLCLNEMKFLD